VTLDLRIATRPEPLVDVLAERLVAPTATRSPSTSSWSPTRACASGSARADRSLGLLSGVEFVFPAELDAPHLGLPDPADDPWRPERLAWHVLALMAEGATSGGHRGRAATAPVERRAACRRPARALRVAAARSRRRLGRPVRVTAGLRPPARGWQAVDVERAAGARRHAVARRALLAALGRRAWRGGTCAGRSTLPARLACSVSPRCPRPRRPSSRTPRSSATCSCSRPRRRRRRCADSRGGTDRAGGDHGPSLRDARCCSSPDRPQDVRHGHHPLLLTWGRPALEAATMLARLPVEPTSWTATSARGRPRRRSSGSACRPRCSASATGSRRDGRARPRPRTGTAACRCTRATGSCVSSRCCATRSCTRWRPTPRCCRATSRCCAPTSRRSRPSPSRSSVRTSVGVTCRCSSPTGRRRRRHRCQARSMRRSRSRPRASSGTRSSRSSRSPSSARRSASTPTICRCSSAWRTTSTCAGVRTASTAALGLPVGRHDRDLARDARPAARRPAARLGGEVVGGLAPSRSAWGRQDLGRIGRLADALGVGRAPRRARRAAARDRWRTGRSPLRWLVDTLLRPHRSVDAAPTPSPRRRRRCARTSTSCVADATAAASHPAMDVREVRAALADRMSSGGSRAGCAPGTSASHRSRRCAGCPFRLVAVVGVGDALLGRAQRG
jgi:hypothetical protein